MQNPIIVKDCAISIDKKGRIVEVVNYGKGSITLTSGNIEVGGLDGGPREIIPLGTPIQIPPGELKPLYSDELAEVVSTFRARCPAIQNFKLTVTIVRSQANSSTTQYAAFHFEIHDCSYRVDEFPFESGMLADSPEVHIK